MTPMQAFIEKAKTDNELMAKLNTLAADGTEADNIVALAAEHGFAITAEDYRQAKEQAGVQKKGELAEEDLETAAGGIFGQTANRWDPEVCNQYSKVHLNCVGFLQAFWCDHYREWTDGVGKAWVTCSMGRFNYELAIRS